MFRKTAEPVVVVQPEREPALVDALERIRRLEANAANATATTIAPSAPIVLPPRPLNPIPKARGRFGEWLDRDRSDAADQRVAEAKIAEAADEQVRGILRSHRLVEAPKPPANYRPLSPAAKQAIALGAEQFRATPEPPRPDKEGTAAVAYRRWQSQASRRGQRAYFHPATGELLGGAGDFPQHVSVDEYVCVTIAWTELDLDGVRVARGHPTLYGVHDDG